MLKTMREGSAYFIKGVMVVIVVAFVGTIFWEWGVRSTPGNLARRGVVATVAGTEISAEQYQRALQRQVETYRQIFGERLDEKLLDALNVKQQVMEGLIRRLLVLHYAAREGIDVSPEELAEHIRRTPAFRGEGGFSTQRYLDLLRVNRLTPEQFESELRRDLIQQKVETLVQAAVKVSDTEVRDTYQQVRRQLTVEVVQLPAEEKAEQAKKLADAITLSMGKGRSLAEAGREAGVPVKRLGPFPAAVPPQDIPDPGAFRQAAAVLKVGETSPLVTGQKASYFIRLVSQQPASEAEFEKERADFRAQFQMAKRQAVMADWLRQLRFKTEVSVDFGNL